MRLRKRAAGLLVGAGVLFAIGTNIQAGWLFALAALLVAAVLAGGVLALGGLRGLEVELQAPVEATQGTPTAVTMTVTNRSRGTRWGVVAEDEHLGGAAVLLGTIRAGERVEATTVRTPPRRGEIVSTGVRLRTGAPFGVAERRRMRVVDATTLVLPQVLPLAHPAIIDTAVAHEPATRTDHRRGLGPDYLSAREYRSGDPMRHVHWGLTARHGRLMVREFEQERTPRLAIWLGPERDLDALDRCCTVAASILDAATASGGGVRLLSVSETGVEAISRSHRLDLLRWLAYRDTVQVRPTTAIERLDPAQLRGVGTLAVVVSAQVADEVEPETWDLLQRSVSRLVLVPVGEDPALVLETFAAVRP